MDQNHCTLNTKHFKIALKKGLFIPKNLKNILCRQVWYVLIHPHFNPIRGLLSETPQRWLGATVEQKILGAWSSWIKTSGSYTPPTSYSEKACWTLCMHAHTHTHIYIYIYIHIVYYVLVLAIIIHLDTLQAQAWYSNKPCHAPMRCLPVELGGSTLADLNTMLSMGLAT